MKLVKKIHIFFFIFSMLNTYANSEFEANFIKANELYQKNKFEESVVEYEKLIEAQQKSENLYYNLANSYFKTDALGKAILYYEKTLKINPYNTQARHNLQLANTKIKDKIETLPDLIFIAWWKKLIYYFSINTWAWISISLSWLAILFFTFYLFTKNNFIHKTSFFKAFLFSILSVFTLLITAIVSEKIFIKDEVVLINKSSYTKDAPSKNGSNQDLYFEGIKLTIIDKVDGYYKTKTSEGNIVWLNADDFSEI